MSLHVTIFSVILSILANAGELPWIGVSLDYPEARDKSATELAEGVSLKVTKVVQGSPLAEAGGEVGDLWWKLDDQILINKRQMLVLLRTKSPGDTVRIEFYREGELRSLSLVLISRKTAAALHHWNSSIRP